MERKEFKAESKRLLDLMINSIYTHKEIFLREIISNASDAIDKLSYLSLTDDKVGISRDQFAITLAVDKERRLLTVSDNGIGMDQSELENNLGVIASSGSLRFRQEMEGEAAADTDIIGQFGVGFYSAFMVADEITVVTKKYGANNKFSIIEHQKQKLIHRCGRLHHRALREGDGGHRHHHAHQGRRRGEGGV